MVGLFVVILLVMMTMQVAVCICAEDGVYIMAAFDELTIQHVKLHDPLMMVMVEDLHWHFARIAVCIGATIGFMLWPLHTRSLAISSSYILYQWWVCQNIHIGSPHGLQFV